MKNCSDLNQYVAIVTKLPAYKSMLSTSFLVLIKTTSGIYKEIQEAHRAKKQS